MTRVALLLFCVAALLSGCKRNQAEPRYCAQDLSGVWVNSSDESFAYRLTDGRELVRGQFFHRQPDGGEAPHEAGDEPMLIELHRTATALTGTMRTKGESPGGKPCDLEFTLRVTSCQPDALQVVAETSYDVREDCTRQKAEDGGDIPPRLTEYRWERASAAKPR
jgi:hypothetical protein